MKKIREILLFKYVTFLIFLQYIEKEKIPYTGKKFKINKNYIK